MNIKNVAVYGPILPTDGPGTDDAIFEWRKEKKYRPLY